MSDRPKYGPDRLLEQFIDFIVGDWEWQVEEALGDSKIEKLLFFALVTRANHGATEHDDLRIASTEDAEKRLMEDGSCPMGSNRMIIRPQAEIGGRRVDFLIWAMDWTSPRQEDWKWRPLIVECDGHNYHERTKEQAAKDRSKDRAATLNGIETFRFTGSEIWRDPWGCAAQISDWASKGFGG